MVLGFSNRACLSLIRSGFCRPMAHRQVYLANTVSENNVVLIANILKIGIFHIKFICVYKTFHTHRHTYSK